MRFMSRENVHKEANCMFICIVWTDLYLHLFVENLLEWECPSQWYTAFSIG